MTALPDSFGAEIDPVSHEEIDPQQAAGSTFYNGRRYYFATRVNKMTFDENPSLWISTPHGSLTSASLTPVADE